ncbi:MAG TPA: sulfurtransferase [Acidimicrobiia bacterium]|nr:sulfurtransferase [Acidimicrobiia bacterium]
MHPLISPLELMRAAPPPRLCDLRWDLTDPNKGRSTYEAGHIPGAVFVDLDRDLSAPPGLDGRHPLPNPADFAVTLTRLGIAPETHVVVYDDTSGTIAARLWWMLRAIGHERVQLLDGGLEAWVAEEGPLEVGDVTVAATEYPDPLRFAGVAGYDGLSERLVVDARAPERYRGDYEPVDPKPGHIPGAINVPTAKNLDGNGRFLDPDRLEALYRAVPDGAVVSCGSGVTACHNALAMVVAGRPMPDVYVGSYSEWSRRDFPVETG